MPRVLYCHGLESGPMGFKVRMMRQGGLEVAAPDMKMSLWNPFKQARSARHHRRRAPVPTVLARGRTR